MKDFIYFLFFILYNKNAYRRKEYEKSFNKVVNEALFYGIEILFNEVFKIEKPKEEKKETI